MFKQLTKQEEREYRKWAIENYEPFSEINGTWHPVVQDECRKLNQEIGGFHSEVS